MRNLFSSKLTVLAIAGAVACSFFTFHADARRAYDSSGSSSQSSSSTSNPYATSQSSTPSTTSTTKTTSTSSNSQSAAPSQYMPPQNYTPPQNQYTPPRAQYTPPRNQYMPPRGQYTPPQNQYTAPQNQYTQQQGTNPYPHQTKSNGTNFYGISPAQLSNGAIQDTTNTGAGGGGGGGYDPRWNPNFGTGIGAQAMARGSSGLAQSLRDNFPLPMNGDEAQMFQVNNFAARSNGGMQGRPR